MKTIGVLGGLGPQATMDFEARVHRIAQALIPHHANSGYPPMVVYYHRRPPFIMQNERMPAFPLQPDPDLLDAARWLGEKADFLVITANGPHIAHVEIEQASGCSVLSMIHATLGEVKRRGWHKVGVLGFGDPSVPVYTRPLSAMNIAHEVIGIDLQERLNDAVLGFQAGRDDAQTQAIVSEAVAALRAKGVDAIILGCTELPLMLHEHANAPDLVNPAQLLAEAAVRFAIIEDEQGR